jgi:hypothetical protein
VAPWWMLAVVVGLCACKTDECIKVSAECAPLYQPSFDQLFSRTLQPTCATGGSSCHGPTGKKGELVFDTAENAYGQLVGRSGPNGEVRVVAGDPGCSLLVVKLESSDAKIQMPPGSPLEAGERCAIIQWIANGAKR